MQIHVAKSRAHEWWPYDGGCTAGGILRVLRPRFCSLRAPSAKIDQIDIPMEKIQLGAIIEAAARRRVYTLLYYATLRFK